VDIRQLLIETHGLAEGKGVKTSDFFDDIQTAGFALFSKEPNIHPQATPGCAEWSFVRLDKAFFAEADEGGAIGGGGVGGSVRRSGQGSVATGR
jgi:Methyltransferase domain